MKICKVHESIDVNKFVDKIIGVKMTGTGEPMIEHCTNCKFKERVVDVLIRNVNIMTKVNTIKLQGKEYAQVKDRLTEFREKNPNGLIETSPTLMSDGNVMFKARILKDKSDENSAEATGHALGMNKGVKAFEKLETIAVGRALALLGYATNGDIASSEEMEEFMEYQQTKKQEIVFDLMSKVDEITSLEELRKFYTENKGLGKELDEYITKKSKELKNGNS